MNLGHQFLAQIILCRSTHRSRQLSGLLLLELLFGLREIPISEKPNSPPSVNIVEEDVTNADVSMEDAAPLPCELVS